MASNKDIAVGAIKTYRDDILLFVEREMKLKPDLWQERALLAFANKDEKIVRMSLQACAGPGKLIRCTTPIFTPDGIKRHGDLQAGDKVFAEDGSVCNVVATIDWDNIQYYRITFSDGTSTECGAQHIWKVQSKHFKKFEDWNIAETQELFNLEPTKIYPGKSRNGTDRKIRKFRIPRQGAVHFSENDKDIDLPLDPYLLGLWLGDGARNASVITKDDTEPFKYLEKIGYEVSKYKKQDGSCQKYNIKGLHKALKLLEISHLYSGERYIPEIYKRASSRQRKEVLRGLLDTDGRIKKNGMMDFHSTSKRLIEDFVWLARSIGQYAHDMRKVDTHKETSDCYSASVRCDFNPFRIERKASRWKQPPEWQMYRYIENIEKLDIGKGRCIEIDHPSHCYLANDFIVTHNSAVLSWCAWWFLLTQGEKGTHPKGVAISVTYDNLKDNLWSEMSKSQNRSKLLMNLFTWTQMRIFSKDHPETWFLAARSFNKSANAEEQGRTLSGVHSKYVLFLIDESGDIPTTVLKAAEQSLSTADKKFGRILQAGNPTSKDGMLYMAQGELKDKWNVISITGDPDDPERSPRIDKKWAEDQIAQYGRDDPWVKSYILGQFPDAAINTLLTYDEVDTAMRRRPRAEEYLYSQKRLGIDVARFGDDSTVIFPRQGLMAYKPVDMRGARTNDIAARVAAAKAKWGSELEFVDGTGGYGAGVVDSLIQAGHKPFEINFSGKASDPRYFNKRSEMWFKMAEWVKRGGALPKHRVLKKELSSVSYTFSSGKFYLEPKERMRQKLGFSPDFADSLALTFAMDEAPTIKTLEGYSLQFNQKPKVDYDPFDEDRW